MRTRWLWALPTLIACSTPVAEDPQLPKALQEPGIVDKMDTYSGRSGGEDLVDALFEDVLESDTALMRLLNDIAAQQEAHADSIRDWENFEHKNVSYYEDAAQHAERISDTTARAKLLARLKESIQRYDASAGSARHLDSTYRSRTIVLNNLEELVRIQRTLEMMERYQKERRPDDALLMSELDRLKALESSLRAMVRE